jgi:hypothetical protein
LNESKERLWIKPEHRHEYRQFRESSDDFRLADRRPLWYALLNDPNILVMDAADADKARGELRDLFRIAPDIVRECIGSLHEEARETLQPITFLRR